MSTNSKSALYDALRRLNDEKTHAIPVRGRDDLQGEWSSGSMALNEEKTQIIITYDDDNEKESYDAKISDSGDDNSLLNEFLVGYIEFIAQPESQSSEKVQNVHFS